MKTLTADQPLLFDTVPGQKGDDMVRATAIDLFAGAGGFTEGASRAGVEVIWAANHSPQAVQWHGVNHTKATHACQDLQQANFYDVPRADIILASPCCQGHSKARGRERAYHDSQRSTAWAVVACAEAMKSDMLIVENVPEFTDWLLYPAWADALARLGYSLSVNVLDSADFGVPQHRERVFIVGTRSKAPVDLKLEKRPHVAVNSVLEWDAYDWNPVNKPGRAENTLRRIENGRKLYGDRFVAPFYGSGSGNTGRSVDRPLGTLTTKDRWSLIRGDQMRMLQIPEAKRVMGFRDDYKLPANHAAAMHMLGNAVCPPVPQALLNALLSA